MAGNNYCPDIESTPLSNRYFSKSNVNFLQNELHDRVFKASNKQFDICRQDDRQLLIIMRSYYLTYAKHAPGHESEEISELNEHVLSYAVPNVLGAIKEQQRSIADLYCPGLNTFDRQGTATREYKTLELNHFY